MYHIFLVLQSGDFKSDIFDELEKYDTQKAKTRHILRQLCKKENVAFAHFLESLKTDWEEIYNVLLKSEKDLKEKHSHSRDAQG